VDFTELVVLKPSLMSKRYQIPNLPTVRLLLIQGSLELPEWPGTNQILYAHQFADKVLPPETHIFTILDPAGKPLGDPSEYASAGPVGWKVAAYRDAVLLRFIAALKVAAEDPALQERLRSAWCKSISSRDQLGGPP
jgi:hypothetical protein